MAAESTRSSSSGTKATLRRLSGNQPPVKSPNASGPDEPFGGGSNEIAAHAVRVARGGNS